MKKVSLVVVSTLVLALAPFAHTPATAATVKCAKTTSVPHTPKVTNPPRQVDKKLPTKITFYTNCGVITANLDPKAPFTVTQIAALVRAKYFDKSLCHRLINQGFSMLQCGDPTASGTGGPGFTYSDENLPIGAKLTYPAGTLAMANSGPNTNGSQFFMVFEDSGALGPNYSIWGKITKGLDIRRSIS